MRVSYRDSSKLPSLSCDRCGRATGMRQIPEAVWIDSTVSEDSLASLFHESCKFCGYSWKIESPCIFINEAGNYVGYPMVSHIDFDTQTRVADELIRKYCPPEPGKQLEKIVAGDLRTFEMIASYPPEEAVEYGRQEGHYLARAHLPLSDRIDYLLNAHRAGDMLKGQKLSLAIAPEEATEGFVDMVRERLAAEDLLPSERIFLETLANMLSNAVDRMRPKPTGLRKIIQEGRLAAIMDETEGRRADNPMFEKYDHFFKDKSAVTLPDLPHGPSELGPPEFSRILTQPGMHDLLMSGFEAIRAANGTRLAVLGDRVLSKLSVNNDDPDEAGFVACPELAYGLMFLGRAALDSGDLVLAERHLQIAISILSGLVPESEEERVGVSMDLAYCHEWLGIASLRNRPGAAVSYLEQCVGYWHTAGFRKAEADNTIRVVETLNTLGRDTEAEERLNVMLESGLDQIDDTTAARTYLLRGIWWARTEVAQQRRTGRNLTLRYFLDLSVNPAPIYRQATVQERPTQSAGEESRDDSLEAGPMTHEIVIDFLGSGTTISLGLIDSPGMGFLWRALAHAKRSGDRILRLVIARCIALMLSDSSATEFAAWVIKGEIDCLNQVIISDESVAMAYIVTALELVFTRQGADLPAEATDVVIALYDYAASRPNSNPQIILTPLFNVVCRQYLEMGDWTRFTSLATWLMGTGEEMRKSISDPTSGRSIQQFYFPAVSRLVAAYMESGLVNSEAELLLCSYALSARFRSSGHDGTSLPPALDDLVGSLGTSEAFLLFIPFELRGAVDSDRNMVLAVITAAGLLNFARLDMTELSRALEAADLAIENRLPKTPAQKPTPVDDKVITRLASAAIPATVIDLLLAHDVNTITVSGIAEIMRLPIGALFEMHPANRDHAPFRAVMEVIRNTSRIASSPGRAPRILYFGMTDTTGRPIGLPASVGRQSRVVSYSTATTSLDTLMAQAPEEATDMLIYFGHAEFSGLEPTDCIIELGGERKLLVDVLRSTMSAVRPSVVILGACGVGVIDTWTFWASREIRGPVECALANGARAVVAPLWPQFALPLSHIVHTTTSSLLDGKSFAESAQDGISEFRQSNAAKLFEYSWTEWAGIGLFGDPHWRLHSSL